MFYLSRFMNRSTFSHRMAVVYEDCFIECDFEDQLLETNVPTGYHPSNESMQQLASFLVRNSDPNNVTSMVQSVFGNVSFPFTQSGQTIRIPSTGSNGNGQNKDVNGNHLVQKENDTQSTENTAGLANEVMHNRLTIDPIASASIAQVNGTVDWPQRLTASTPFHAMDEEAVVQAPMNASFQPIESFLDKHIDPNNVTSTIEAIIGDVSMLAGQIDQPQAIDPIETRPNETNNGVDIIKTANAMTPPEANGPESNDLDDINSIIAADNKVIDFALPSQAVFGSHNDTIKGIAAAGQAVSDTRENKSTDQQSECINLTREDVEPPSEGATSSQIARNAVQQEGNQRQKRKITEEPMSDEGSNKKRKMDLGSTLKTIPESTSGEILNRYNHRHCLTVKY